MSATQVNPNAPPTRAELEEIKENNKMLKALFEATQKEKEKLESERREALRARAVRTQRSQCFYVEGVCIDCNKKQGLDLCGCDANKHITEEDVKRWVAERSQEWDLKRKANAGNNKYAGARRDRE